MQWNLKEIGLLTDDQRLREIARIFAAGILRLHARAALPAVSDEQDSPEKSTL